MVGPHLVYRVNADSARSSLEDLRQKSLAAHNPLREAEFQQEAIIRGILAERLLRYGQIDTTEFLADCQERLGGFFSPQAFERACRSIDQCLTV